MNVREIMTENPVCCAPESTIGDAAKLTAGNDYGRTPVVDGDGHRN